MDMLISGNTKSCGCLQKQLAAKRRFQHGQSQSGLYKIWSKMKRRCEVPTNNGYHNYGGRGIKVCDAWQSFEQFAADVGPRPSEDYSLDRIDNDKGYSPENVRWATAKTQGRNRRGLLEVCVDGQKMCLAEAIEKYNMPYQAVYARMFKHGWTLDEALTVPVSIGQKYQHQKHLGIRKAPSFQKPKGVRFDWAQGRYVKETEA
ncbi:hypothetical protein LJR231_003507 [Phyllobacterium sp. LjRoot231]|uniref:hypothetical protein n=1 Tax=Phyllobacterium sp. LjRoot231 TaxID=3342289 RepID=UPI003ECEBEF8